MDTLKNILDKVDRLKAELDQLGPLDSEARDRLAQKIRMEWNYHSNVIEGNDLDWGETKSLLLHGLTAHGKPLKDHLDMKGHNEALKKLEKLAGREIRITEKLIQEFHEIIIEDPFKEHPEVEPGKYKRDSNYLYNEQGERIDFVLPEQVAPMLNELINWTNNSLFVPKRKKQKYETHPLLIAAIFHMRFINIHPFADGNGRICRILMNIILMQCGFPPAIIKKDDRNEYFRAIQKSREEGEQFLAVFLGKALIQSLELYLKAAKGEPIEEADDLDKKLALLEKELEGIDSDEEVKKQFSAEVLMEIYDGWFSDLLRKAIPAVQKFNRFFLSSRHQISMYVASADFDEQFPDEVISELREVTLQKMDRIGHHQYKINFYAQFGPFKKGGLKSFGCNYGFEIRFDQIKYEIWVDEFSGTGQKKELQLYSKLLHKPLVEAEINDVVNRLSEAIFQHIDHYTKQTGLR